MAKKDDATSRGVKAAPLPPATHVELFGHVTLVEGYALSGFTGCHALVALRDTPGKTVAVLTSEVRLQSLLETLLGFFDQGVRPEVSAWRVCTVARQARKGRFASPVDIPRLCRR